MNQILMIENKGGKNKGNRQPIDTKKIIAVFATIIIVFGVILIGVGIIQMNKNKTGKSNYEANNNTPVATTTSTPDSPASITPDENDTEEPTLQLSILGRNKIKVVAKDDVGLAYVEYTWNNGEQQIIEVDEDATDRTTIETYIDIIAGQNTLRVNAVDLTGKSKEKIQEFKGIVLPEISAFITSDGNAIMLKIECSDGLDHIVCRTNNGQGIQLIFSGEYASFTKEQWAQVGVFVEKSDDGNVTNMEYTYPFSEDTTGITVTAYSTKGEVETYEGKIN